MSLQNPDRTGIKGPDANAREKLLKTLEHSSIPESEKLTNLGLFTRSVMLAKTLYLNELYRLILKTPGVIMEFGSWYGSNLATFCNLRNVYEPYNHQRLVIGFDTFSGYKARIDAEGDCPIKEGQYSTGAKYKEELENILTIQESDNFQSHIKKFRLVEGDVCKSLPEYLKNNQQTIVALAYFDIGYAKPNTVCLSEIKEFLVPGSVLAIDHLNNEIFPQETCVFRNVIQEKKIYMSEYLSDRAYVIW